MKSKIKTTLINILLLSAFFTSSLQAKDEYIYKGIPAGYKAIISFTNNSIFKISEPTLEACELALRPFTRGNDVSHNKEGIIVQGLVVSTTSDCLTSYEMGLSNQLGNDSSPVGLKFPWGPLCWSCPALNETTFDLLYGNYSDEIANLYRVYDIESYNRKLEELQSEYDLSGFEKEVHGLNQRMNEDLR